MNRSSEAKETTGRGQAGAEAGKGEGEAAKGRRGRKRKEDNRVIGSRHGLNGKHLGAEEVVPTIEGYTLKSGSSRVDSDHEEGEIVDDLALLLPESSGSHEMSKIPDSLLKVITKAKEGTHLPLEEDAGQELESVSTTSDWSISSYEGRLKSMSPTMRTDKIAKLSARREQLRRQLKYLTETRGEKRGREEDRYVGKERSGGSTKRKKSRDRSRGRSHCPRDKSRGRSHCPRDKSRGRIHCPRDKSRGRSHCPRDKSRGRSHCSRHCSLSRSSSRSSSTRHGRGSSRRSETARRHNRESTSSSEYDRKLRTRARAVITFHENRGKVFPYNYMNFVETLLGWELKWKVILEDSDATTILPPLFRYPDILQIAKKAICYDRYCGHDQFKYAHIPRLLIEALKYVYKHFHELPPESINTTALLMKNYEQLEQYSLFRVTAEIQREGISAQFSSGDVITVQFTDRETAKHLGLVINVRSFEDFENKTMGGTLRHVIDEYEIHVRDNVGHRLNSLRGERRDFEASFLCNIKSLLLQVDAIFRLRIRTFVAEFLEPISMVKRIEKIPLDIPDPRSLKNGIEIGVGFAIDAERDNLGGGKHYTPRILCLTTHDKARRMRAAQAIVRYSVRTKGSVRLLLVTTEESLGEWAVSLRGAGIKFYNSEEKFDPIIQELALMERAARSQYLIKEMFYVSSREEAPKPRMQTIVLNEINSWIEGKFKVYPISPYTSYTLSLFVEKKRQMLVKNVTVVMGTYAGLSSDHRFRSFLSEKSLSFDCCLVDEGHRLSELDALSLLYYPIRRLLLLGDDVPLSGSRNQVRGQKTLIERFANRYAHVVI